MKSTKIIIIALYTLIVVCIGFATVIEKYYGTTFVSDNIYGAWWFSVLWAMLTVAALGYIMKQRLYKRVAVMLLHLSFVVILAGALTTHLFARRGSVRLRTNIPEMTFVDKDNQVEHLSFTLTLKEFRVINYPGTDAPLDYQSVIQSGDEEVLVSMNHIGNIDGYRLFQQSYDTDEEGVTLGISYDPYGIAITYFGYLMLFLGIIATLLSRHTQMRSLYRKAIAVAVLFFGMNIGAVANSCVPSVASDQRSSASLFTLHSSLPVVDAEIAHRMGTIQVLYNNRICPLNTVATDFTMKVAGSASWKGYSADEVFFSWMIYYMPWEEALLTNNPKQKGADERKAIVEMFYNGQFTKIFSYRLDNVVNWYSPGGQILPREIPVKEQFFVKQSMDFLTEAIVTGQRDRAFEIIAKIKLFQRDMIGDVLPSKSKIQAELFYNMMRSQKWPVFLSLTLSLLFCIVMLFWRKRIIHSSLFTFSFILFTYITLSLGLRWWLGGHIPVSNGPETMLFMAWVMLLLTILIQKKFPLILAFGPLISSFCLLVAMLGGGSSQLTPLMPVLQSPLLSIHVMTVMCAYALFALQMIIGIYAVANSCVPSVASDQRSSASLFTLHSSLERVTALSQLLLYPAVFLLTIGIFLGAVWANVSWGNYWSWDPKESWALITMMIYAIPLHKASFGIFRNPRFYHIYMVVAFLAVIITYFGVNYLLGGMHSYA